MIAIFCFNKLLQFGLEKLWIEFGVGINKGWIPIHDLTSVLRIKSARLLFWYAFTACDAVSAFGGKGNYQCEQLGGCLTISCLPLKKTHTKANTFKSKTKTIKFWKYPLPYFTVEQHLTVSTNADAIYFLNKGVKLIPSHQQNILFCNTSSVLCIRQD